MKKYFLTNQKFKTYLLMTAIFLYCFITKLKYLAIPLIEDEVYYARNGIFSSINEWVNLSFGHPPGWNLIFGVAYQFLPPTSYTAHLTALLINSMAIAFTFYSLCKIQPRSTSLLATFLIISHPYFLTASSLSHPVILATLLGIIALIHLSLEDWIIYSIFISLAVVVRESAIVFAASALIVLGLKRKPKFYLTVLAPILVLAFFYAWNYLAKDNLLLNPAMRDHISHHQSLFNYNYQHIRHYLVDHYLRMMPLSIWVILIPTLVAHSLYRKRVTAVLIPTQLILLLTALLHFTFFALYPDRALRNQFMSASCLMLFTVIYFSDIGVRVVNNLKLRSVCKLVITIAVIFSSYHYINNHWSLINSSTRIANNIKEVSSYLLKQFPNIDNLDIVSSNPLTQYFENPELGYTKTAILMRSHGGQPGQTQIGDPDLIIIANNYLGTFAFDELKSFVVQKNYQKITTIRAHSEFETIIYQK